MSAVFMGRLFGFVREIFISAKYGTSAPAEAYFIAITIPTVMLAILPAALNSICTPLFAEYKAKGDLPGLQRIFNTITSLVLLLTLFLSIVGMVGAKYVVAVLAPGFDGELLALTEELVTLIFPSIVFVGLISIFWSYLNAQNHFLMPSIGPLIASIVVILSIFTLVPIYGIHGLAIGTVIGFVFQGIVMYPSLRKQTITVGFGLDFRNPALKRVLYLAIPIVIGMTINQLNVIVDRILGSGLEEGKFAAYVYATRIYQLPMGIFVSAVTLPLFPLLSEYASHNNHKSLVSTLWQGIKALAFIMLPVTVFLLVLGEPVVRLLFERAEFTRESTIETSWALWFLAIGFFPFAARDLLTRVFYALQDTKTPVIINTVTIIINIIASIILIRYLDQGGLGLGMAIGGICNFFIMLYVLRRKTGLIVERTALIQLSKIVVATTVMAITMLITKPYIIDGTVKFLQQVINLTFISSIGVVTYALVLWALGVEFTRLGLFKKRS